MSKPFIAPLTGLRAFAAFWVLGLHGIGTVAALLPPAFVGRVRTITDPGFLGVDIFFVLSGFIISYNYAAGFDREVTLRSWGRFLWARLGRIYPVHVALLLALGVVVLGLGFGRGGEIEARRWSGAGMIQSLLLVHAWVGQWDVWNPVSWSISSEWLAYLCFPMLSAAALALTRRVGPTAAWVAIIICVTMPAMADSFAGGTVPLSARLVLQILCDFFGGCATYRMFVHGHRGLRVLGPRPGTGILLLVVLAAGLLHAGLSARWTIPLVPWILLSLAAERGRASVLLSHPVAVYWGRVSYSLYMTHYLWLWAAQTVLPLPWLSTLEAPARVGGALFYVLPTLAIAAAMYHVVEEPARRGMASLLRREPRLVPETAPSS